MLSMSRISQKPNPELFPLPETDDDPATLTQAKAAQRIVAALDQGGLAALAIDPASFASLAANARFRALVARPAAEREVKAALRGAGRGAAGLIWHADDGAAHIVRRFDIDECAEPITLITLSDPREEEALRFADFVSRHDITPAEARVLWRLLAGETLADIADSLALSLATIKSQLRSMLAKTGAGRQAALVALYYRSGGHTPELPEAAVANLRAARRLA
ncbi:MAG: helix-turn-helix transcriptional regulator [Methylocystis sp.]|nr:helix-turn-helix transcriptional regulator [Methylocystis sp.]